jgi:hypothetical protein
VNRQPGKEHKEKLFQLKCDRDGWERLYRAEHEKAQRLESQLAQLEQRLSDAEQVIKEQFNDLVNSQRQEKIYRKKLFGV